MKPFSLVGVSASLDSEDYGEPIDEEMVLYDKYEEDATTRILELISEHQVVTDRELKVRLEGDFFPWVTGRVINRLVRNGEIDLVKPPGRKGPMGDS